MIVTKTVAEVADQLVRDAAKNAELNNWLLEQEYVLVELAQKYAILQSGAITPDGPMPMPPGLVPEMRKAITSAVSVGFAMAVVGYNEQYSGEISEDILKSSIQNNIGLLYERWINGLMDDEYYDKDNPKLSDGNVDVTALGKDWEVAVDNHGKIQDSKKTQEARINITKVLDSKEELTI